MRLLVRSRNHVIRAIALVGSDVVGVVDRGHRMHILQVRIHDLLEIVVVDSSALHSVTDVHRADIPSADDQVVGVHQRQQSLERDVQVTSRNGSNLHGRALGDGAVVVRVLLALLRMPSDLVLVGKNSSRHRGSVVATPADEHHSNLGNASVGLEHILLVLGSNHNLSVLDLGLTRVVHVVGGDRIVGIGDVGGVNNNRRINILIRRVHYKSWF